MGFACRQVVLAMAVWGVAGAAAAQGLGTAFTYQGRLTDAGVPAAGPYDLELKLFDTATGGAQVGATVVREDVLVAAGLFTVKVDFGAGAFTGRPLWLEIGVRPGASQGPFTPLAGRQELTPTPNALFSAAAPWTGIAGKPAGFADDLDDDALGALLCANGQVPKRSGAAWTCAADADSGGDITAVTTAAGSGLTGGASSGAASLAVAFGGTGTATTVARTDHGHVEYVPTTDSRLLGLGGVNNVLAGLGAGENNVGSNNAFFGRSAGAANTGGNSGSFYGALAGQQNTTGPRNSFFGANAGQSNTTASDNAFFGFGAGQASTGLFNAFFGSGTGDSNTSGAANAFFGRNAGTANTTGSDNAFFGHNAGLANTASDNSFFGSGAGDSNTTGSFNSFFGRQAGGANTVQLGNSFFGYLAGLLNQGSNNAFFGRLAGADNTTGFNGAFFGSLAGQSNSSGEYNAFFGALAGSANTTGSLNAFFGANAGLNSTSTANTFVGGNAGTANTLGFGNVFVGYQAGLANTTGVNNTLLGANTNTFGGALSFATAVGSGALATNSNTVVLGRPADTVRVPGGLAVQGDADVQGGVDIGAELTVGGSVTATGGVFTDGLLDVDANANIEGNLFVGGHIRFVNLQDSFLQPLCYTDSGPAPFAFRIGFCSSSLRFKTDVEDYSAGLGIVERLRPVTFTWRRQPVRDLGLIAEEVAEVDPLLASYDRDGQVQGVKYNQLTAVLINAIKEQQAQIAGLREQLDGLKALVCRSQPDAAACR